MVGLNLLERFNQWIQESVMIKLFSIGFLMLVLLIPSQWIKDLMFERQTRAAQMIEEVSGKWSGPQTITGPILVIPYIRQEVIIKGDQTKEIREYVEKAFFLPNDLKVQGKVAPEILHRGIFDAVVYESSLNLEANFAQPDLKSLSIPDDRVRWHDAYLVFGISDVRGISDNFSISVGGENLEAEPSNNIGVSIAQAKRTESSDDYRFAKPLPPSDNTKGIISKLHWQNAGSFTSHINIKLNLKGRHTLDFIPVGKTTAVDLEGSWNNPSFDGEFLPNTRTVTESGFAANWKILHFNRPFAQQWTGPQQLDDSNFGVKLLIPVDQYQKSIRTAKYGALIILFTFMALFLVELTQKIRIHPFQYILIGIALTIYYTLLLSLSEHVGYNTAYLIASAATVILIALYSRTFFSQFRLTLLFTVLLVIFYTFIFLIILQQDFSLLLGSIGLFIIVATLMYFSRNVRWYKETR